jgi:hypothetical protein
MKNTKKIRAVVNTLNLGWGKAISDAVSGYITDKMREDSFASMIFPPGVEIDEVEQIGDEIRANVQINAPAKFMKMRIKI